MISRFLSNFFFFNDSATTEIYTLSLHDALPISCRAVTAETGTVAACWKLRFAGTCASFSGRAEDRKSTRLNSSHMSISYAVFCLKKKKKRAVTLYLCLGYDLLRWMCAI